MLKEEKRKVDDEEEIKLTLFGETRFFVDVEIFIIKSFSVAKNIISRLINSNRVKKITPILLLKKKKILLLKFIY